MGVLNFIQFSEMIMFIYPAMPEKYIKEMFRIMDQENKDQVDLKTLVRRICKITMQPNIKDKDIRSSMKKMKEKSR